MAVPAQQMEGDDWQVVDALVSSSASSAELEAAAVRWQHRAGLAGQLRRQARLRAAEEEFEDPAA